MASRKTAPKAKLVPLTGVEMTRILGIPVYGLPEDLSSLEAEIQRRVTEANTAIDQIRAEYRAEADKLLGMSVFRFFCFRMIRLFSKLAGRARPT